MITVDKLNFYRKHDGDLDGLARSIDSDTSPENTESDWEIIEQLRTGLWRINRVSCSKSYKESVEKEIEEQVADQGAKDLLLEIALKGK